MAERGLAGPVIVVVMVTALFVLAALLPGGQSSRCESAGGQFLVGPAGETVCLNEHSLTPVSGFEGVSAN